MVKAKLIKQFNQVYQLQLAALHMLNYRIKPTLGLLLHTQSDFLELVHS